MMYEQLLTKNIIISGGSSGIGKECAIECSKHGANVLILGRNRSKLDETLHSLSPGSHSSLVIDLSNPEEIEHKVSEALATFGKIDGFVHSAGLEKTIPFDFSKPNLFKDIFNVNVFSGFELSRIISNKRYISSNGASFVFIASILGVVGRSGAVAYCASKGAVISGMKALALELIRKKIRVNAVSPAIVETMLTKSIFEGIPEESVQTLINQHPLGLGNPGDIAQSCIFLLSEKSRWITGSNLIIDGGYSIQ